MSRRLSPYAVVALAAALPRLAVLVAERGDILARYTEKSDDFARVLAGSGTFGLVPGEPSAYTQPLYGLFLAPLYWIFGREWLAVGLVQTLVAAATAVLVYELARRVISPRAALLAALAATLQPYLVWHDVHVNREILDQLVAAALVLLVLLAAERGTTLLALATGAVAGVAILGNTRLVALPLLLAGYLFARRRARGAALALLVAAALVVTPWIVRNRVQVGCWTVTTDARALWKANNERTYAVLAGGGWLDNVPDPPGAPPTPEMAASIFERNGVFVPVDECAQMRDYQDRVFDFWRDRPGEKARLAAQAASMLWNPLVTATEDRPGEGGFRDVGRKVAMPVYTGGLFAFALVGLRLVPRAYAALALALLAYQTLAAMLFAGATRYRVPWDFLLAVPAAAAATALARRVRKRRKAQA